MNYLHAAVLSAIMALAGYGSYQLGILRMKASQSELSEQIATLEREKGELRLAISEQNAAVKAAEERAKAAELARQLALDHASAMALLSKGRMDRLDKALDELQTSAEVLKHYWELRQ